MMLAHTILVVPNTFPNNLDEDISIASVLIPAAKTDTYNHGLIIFSFKDLPLKESDLNFVTF